jgi:hypothetical protein
MRSTKTLILLMFCAMLLAQALHATAVEGDYFSISGTVTDANWSPIQGALVTLYDNDFNPITTQDTNEYGHFYFQNVAVKTYLCTVRVSYTESGAVHSIPGYYIKHYPANGIQSVAPEETHYDNYYLPGSMPKVCTTPAVTPTATPAPTAVPAAEPNNSAVTSILLFVGGFIAGSAVATLACYILLWPPGRDERR